MAELKSPLVWKDGAPRSALYGDIYFSLEDGLAESRAVFLEGCGLPLAWAGRSRFCVGELGFGSGLNICALLDLWRTTRERGAQLHIFSLEAHPMSCEDAAQALAAFPDIAPIAALILAQWPGRRRGVTRIELPSLGAILDVAVVEVGEGLAGWSGTADAWFLDGFSPALNPAMWRSEVLGLVRGRSADGARLATFTVAGEVRRGLEAVGFMVEKKPGFGRKRQRLEAHLESAPGAAVEPVSTAIIGAGIAGQALARAFAALGAPVTLFADPGTVAASGNPAALVTPALDAGGGARAALYAEAFARAVRLYGGVESGVIATQALQIEADDRDPGRFDKVAAQDIFEPGSLARFDAAAAADAMGEPLDAGGLLFRDALVVDPAAIQAAWAPDAIPARVVAMKAEGGGVTLTFADGRSERFSRVIIANGTDAARLLPGVPVAPVRGQASVAEGVSPGLASAFGGYAIPTRTGVLFGATHDRGVTGTSVREEDHGRNLALLALRRPVLARAVEGKALTGRAAVRGALPDRLPAAGVWDENLFLLAGLGSRGFTTAPLLAEHVAALALGVPSPLAGPLAALVSPERLKP